MKIDTILEGDSRILIDSLDLESVDCVITSPPYFNLRDYGIESQIGLEPSPGLYVSQLLSVLGGRLKMAVKKTGNLWVNIGDSYVSNGAVDNKEYLENHPEKNSRSTANARRCLYEGAPPKTKLGIPYRFCCEMMETWRLRQTIIWRKPGNQAFTGLDRLPNEHEYFFHFVRDEGLSKGYYFDQSPFKVIKRKSWDEEEDQLSIMGDVWDIPNKIDVEHPAAFSETIISKLVESSSPPGGLVLDPFMGSGTVARVANKLGRHFLGFELNPKFIEQALDSLRQEELF